MVTPRVRSSGLKPIIDHLKMVDKINSPEVFIVLSKIIYTDDKCGVPKGLLTECDDIIYTLANDYPDGFTLTGFNVKIEPSREKLGRGLTPHGMIFDDNPYFGGEYDEYPL